MDAEGLPFTKMHGCRNDYVVVDALRLAVAAPAALARAMADRRAGVGSDGLLLALPSDCADLRMRMLNPDGSEAEMCGNGLRCLALFAAARGLVADPTNMRVETGAGTLAVSVTDMDATGRSARVTVDMGRPVVERPGLAMHGPAGRVLEEPLTVDGAVHAITAVSMGNPHAILFVDDVDAAPVTSLGPRIECDAMFPERTNVEFVQVLEPGLVRQRTWERGAGETLACGTGACAVVVAGVLTGRTARTVRVRLRGGELEIQWAADDHVFMTGPAEIVFDGVWPEGRGV